MPKKKPTSKPATTDEDDLFPQRIASCPADHERVREDPRALPDPDEVSYCDIPLELRLYEGVGDYPFPVHRLTVHFLLLLDSYYEVRPASQVASGVWKSELHGLLLKEYAAAQEWPLSELENKTTTARRLAKWIIQEQIHVVNFPWADKFLWFIGALPMTMGSATAGAPLAVAEVPGHAGTPTETIDRAEAGRRLREKHNLKRNTAVTRVSRWLAAAGYDGNAIPRAEFDAWLARQAPAKTRRSYDEFDVK